MEIRETTKVPLIIGCVKGQKLPWFGYFKQGDETKEVRTIIKCQPAEKRPRERQ